MVSQENENLGIRMYEVHKENDVGRGIEVLRSMHRAFWSGLDDDDIHRLRWSLGEAWGLMGQRTWESLIFSDMSWNQIIELIEIARDVENQLLDAPIGAQRAQRVLMG